jgi:hypothetical protein
MSMTLKEGYTPDRLGLSAEKASQIIEVIIAKIILLINSEITDKSLIAIEVLFKLLEKTISLTIVEKASEILPVSDSKPGQQELWYK